MQEDQNIEWKEHWKDEYLKWICGFANSQGGKLIIGKNDKGVVTGVPDSKKLLEDIPNKVRDILGIVIDVNLKHETGKEYLEIKVEPYPNPISYKGTYHYRSGSTKQELKGAALDRFLLKKHGKTWDSVPVPYVSVKDLDTGAFDYFRENAVNSKRLGQEVLKQSNNHILENLNLLENDYLKRAAVLLFHPAPEKFITGAYVKIGFFASDTDLLYQNEVNGNLFEQVEKTMDLLLTKYLKAYISYKGIHRVEDYLFPEKALREAVLNAISHKDYSSHVPIQIKVYEDKIIIRNEGHLPDNWTAKKLRYEHSSNPFNPSIANTFFRAGMIESWGRGTLTIIEECRKHGCPTPLFKYEQPDFMLKIQANEILKKVTSLKGTLAKSSDIIKSEKLKTKKVSGKTSGKTSGKILAYISENPEITIPELSVNIGITERSIERNIQKLQQENKLKRTGGAKGGKWELIG